MVYVFVGYDYLPNLDSPESWFNVAKVYFGLLTHLSKENTVYNINQINCERFCMHEGVHNYFLKTGKSKNYFPLKINLLIKSLSPDVVLVQGLHNPLQVFQLALILPKRTKIIAQHHAEKPFNGIKKYIQRMADPFINAYLFASSAIGIDWLNKGNLGAGKKIFQVMEVSSVFYPVDKKLSRIKTGIQGEPTFLWVGRLNNNKDPLTVVTAFLMFLDIQPRARLYMIFHTDELSGEIKKLLNQSKHKDGVLLVGKIKHEELLYWYNSANFFISGSHYEGSGTALCEAMSCGCVPVVTVIPSFNMITNEGACGLLYKAGDENGLLDVLLQTTHLNVEEKKSKCLEYFRSTLSFKAIAESIQAIVESL